MFALPPANSGRGWKFVRSTSDAVVLKGTRWPILLAADLRRGGRTGAQDTMPKRVGQGSVTTRSCSREDYVGEAMQGEVGVTGELEVEYHSAAEYER